MPVKPSEQEEEYFARQEFERRKQVLAEQESKIAEEERLRAGRGKGPLPQVRRAPSGSPLPGGGAGQVLALPGRLAGLRRIGPSHR